VSYTTDKKNPAWGAGFSACCCCREVGFCINGAVEVVLLLLSPLFYSSYAFILLFIASSGFDVCLNRCRKLLRVIETFIVRRGLVSKTRANPDNVLSK